MKTVFLDCAIVNPGDISWESLEQICEFSWYERTGADDVRERMKGAEAVMIDAFPINRSFLEEWPELKYIGIAATGFNHVDLDAAKELGVAVTNVPSYASDAVAQHAVALMLALANRLKVYNRAVINGEWQASPDYTFIKEPVMLLKGKSLGIIGYGAIGGRVAEIAQALGMTVNIYSRDPEAAVRSDVVSLNCPLTEKNRKMINREFIRNMKDGAILINTARGGLVDEEALADALRSGKLSGAGLDVMTEEPPMDGSPLIDLENCIITPHIGFIPLEARQVIVDTCRENMESFMAGGRLNRLV